MLLINVCVHVHVRVCVKNNKKLSFRRLLDPLWLVLYVLWLYVCRPGRECRLNIHIQIALRHVEGGGVGAKRW